MREGEVDRPVAAGLNAERRRGERRMGRGRRAAEAPREPRLALRELMGHSSPETTASYVHLSVEQLAAEYGAARATLAAGPR